ncbi:MAG: nicotinate phosphoribosyltransferase [Treponema sp.]|nr:nicotinate phosphoribosyltransferase [Treponema sp.]
MTHSTRTSALFTDFYELTMAHGYWRNDMNRPAVFDLFFRRQPFDGGFSILAGTETMLDALTSFSFSAEDIDYLASLGLFEPAFLDYLKNFHFSGDIYAMDEGSVIFPQEPIIRVHAPLIEAQIVEGLLLNHINFQSLIATKTARIWLAAQKGDIMEFGLRRAQGPDGAMSASRAAFIGGAAGTSNTLAGMRYGIPVRGTMAHSWIMSFPSEQEAFRTYAAAYPDNSIFLIDTYDTLTSGIKSAITVGGELAAHGKNFGVRLDSGDISYLSREVRARLDAAGFPHAQISVSNELTEDIISALTAQHVPIDSWGVGTHLVTGGSESSFTGVYKLAARYDAATDQLVPVMKFSDNPEKNTNPGIKNVFRLYDDNGMAIADIMALDGETIAPATAGHYYHPMIDYREFSCTASRVTPLLKQRLTAGVRTVPRRDDKTHLLESRATMDRQLDSFDASYKRILNPHIYKVSMTKALKDLKLTFIRENIAREHVT